MDPEIFKLTEEELQPEATITSELEWRAPAYPCSPGCTVPRDIKELKIQFQGDIRQWYKDLALAIHILFHKQWEDTPEICEVDSTHHWQTIQFRALPLYKCSGQQAATITSVYGPTHQSRWALAYCFTFDQLKNLRWERFQNAFRARLHKAIATMITLESTYYTIVTDMGQHCTFHVQRSGTAIPTDRHSQMAHTKVDDDRREMSAETSHGMDVLYLRAKADMHQSNKRPSTRELELQIEGIVESLRHMRPIQKKIIYMGKSQTPKRRPPIGQEIEKEETRFQDGTEEGNKEDPDDDQIDTTEIETQLLQFVYENDEEDERAKQQFDKRKL